MKDGDASPLKPPTPELKLDPRPPLPIAAPKVDMAQKLPQKWNTKNLGLRLGADLASAVCAAGLVAPVISMVDRSIMENASGRIRLVDSLKASLRTLLLRPHKLIFSKPFALIVMVYGGTYLTANAVDTATSTVRNKPATHVTSGTTKFAASSFANVGICVFKDREFVRMFGPKGVVPRPVPLASYALFTVRDCMTIFASFNVPPMLSPYLDQRLPEEVQRRVSSQTVAQFVAPASIQLLSTPLHLLGLDLYNRPWTERTATPRWHDRWAAVRKNWAVSAAARIGRIVPAFGVGGVVNIKVRRHLMEKLA